MIGAASTLLLQQEERLSRWVYKQIVRWNWSGKVRKSSQDFTYFSLGSAQCYYKRMEYWDF